MTERRKPKIVAKNSASIVRTSHWRRRVFRLVAIVGVPALLLGLTEVILRLIGVGHPTSFLLTATHDGRKVFVQNNQFGLRFFGPEMARLPHPICIEPTPPTDVVRIIVLGESAAKGDPDPDFGLPRMLEAILTLRIEGVRFEVINAAMTAINSHAILPIARDCLRARPDVLVVYMGNNEVVGPFGAGTVFGQQVPPLATVRTTLALKATRTGQAMDSLIRGMSASRNGVSSWQGMEFFLDQQVRADDPRMSGVYQHFESNLEDILLLGPRYGVAIVVCTVPVNLKDCAPFASAHRPELDVGEKERWDVIFRSGIAEQTSGNLLEASARFNEAAALDESFAELRFRQAQCSLALGNLTEARKHFEAARDLDTLRFRCDTRLNNIIREVASNHENQRMLLADAERAFTEQCEPEPPGNAFFYDHVHLTFEGNWLLASTIAVQVERLLSQQLKSAVSSQTAWPSMEDCGRWLGWSDWARLKGWHGILPRLKRAPFTQQCNHQEWLESVEEAMAALSLARAPVGLSNALQVVEAALAIHPTDVALLGQLAAIQAALGNDAATLTATEQTVRILPSDAEAWSRLGIALVRQRQFEEAVAAFESAAQWNPQDAATLERLAQAKVAAGQIDEAVADFRRLLKARPELGLTWLHFGQVLEAVGRDAQAAECFEQALAHPGRSAAGLIELAGFCQSRGWFEAAAQNYLAAIEVDSGNAELYVGAGQNLAALGQLKEAERHLAEAVRLAPNFAEARLLLGVVVGRQGQTGVAVREFQAALELKPGWVDAHLNLGIATMKDDPAQALTHFEEVLKQSPSNSAALKYSHLLRSRGP